ncbi:hypothetical protein KCU83_g1744, partial [Aureobasidium melanogenum]
MQDVRRILNKATESATETRKRLGIAKHYLEHTKETLQNVSKKMESIVTGLEKEINDSVQISINLIQQRKADIEKANECKKRQFENYQLYHKAVRSMEELKSGEVDQRVGAIYCDGHDLLTESIARWEEENKKAEGEIRKLEWLMKN